MNANERRRRRAALGTAAVVGLSGMVFAPPAEAKDWQGCFSETRGNTARGYCYPNVKTKDLRLWVRCEGDSFPRAAKFDRQTYMSTPNRRGPMPMRAALYDCKELKVVWREVSKYNSWT